MINFQSGYIKTSTNKGNEYIASDNISAISSGNYENVILSLKNPILDQDSGKNSMIISRKGNLIDWIKAIIYSQKTNTVTDTKSSLIDIQV